MSSFLLHPLSYKPCNLKPPLLLSSPRRNGPTRIIKRAAIACLERESPKDESFSKRRVIIYMGFAAIPLLNTNSGLAAENTELTTPNQKQEAEVRYQSVQGFSSQNPFLSPLNVLGFLGSGVLGFLVAAALYVVKKEKTVQSGAQMDAQMVAQMNAELREKIAVASRMEKIIELLRLKVEELEKASGASQSVFNELDGAMEKKILRDQKLLIDRLEISLTKARNEKTKLQEHLNEKSDTLSVLQEKVNLLSWDIKDKEDNLRTVNSKLAEKENELSRLSAVYKETQDQISGLNSEIERLKKILKEKEKELETKNTMVHEK